jgi:hypothetical protein
MLTQTRPILQNNDTTVDVRNAKNIAESNTLHNFFLTIRKKYHKWQLNKAIKEAHDIASGKKKGKIYNSAEEMFNDIVS